MQIETHWMHTIVCQDTCIKIQDALRYFFPVICQQMTLMKIFVMRYRNKAESSSRLPTKMPNFLWPVFPRTMYTNSKFWIIGKFYDPWPPWPNHIMETILIVYQQHNVFFHLREATSKWGKIPLNGLKMDQLDQIWFQIKRKIPLKLTWY